MMQGVQFGNIHSFYDLNLILAPFTPPPATPKTTFVNVDGGDGSLDLTEAHGRVFYKDRTFSFEFSVHNSEELTFDEKVTQISNALNGQRFRITLDRDPDYYWDGRCVVKNHKINKTIGQITVSATVKPYKLKQEPTVCVVEMMSAQDKTVTLTNSKKPVVPTIECTHDNTSITFGDGVYKLNAGTHRILDICLQPGNNTVKIIGQGTITFTYQEGEL